MGSQQITIGQKRPVSSPSRPTADVVRSRSRNPRVALLAIALFGCAALTSTAMSRMVRMHDGVDAPAGANTPAIPLRTGTPAKAHPVYVRATGGASQGR